MSDTKQGNSAALGAENAPLGAQPVDALTKSGFHHGDLKAALIAAAFDLVSEHGVEGFSLADACRRAGVSTAAPYKHFKDRDEILAHVVARGHDLMLEEAILRAQTVGRGSLAAIIMMGHGYVDFAVRRQHVFRLMFGRKKLLEAHDVMAETGRRCFGQVIEEVAHYCSVTGHPGDPQEIAVRLWTFVHGIASLVIDEDYEVVTPGLDVHAMIDKTTPMLLQS